MIASGPKYAVCARTCERAATGGHLQLVRRICEMGVTPSARALHCAARAGNAVVVQYLAEEHGLQPSPWTLDSAIRSGNLPIVRYLCESFGLGSMSDLYTAACERQKRIVVYLLGRVTAAAGFTAVDGFTTEKIIKHNWSDLVGLLCEPGPYVATFIAASSIDLDRIRCLERALDCGAALDPDLMVRAARQGSVPMLDLLVRRGLAWSWARCTRPPGTVASRYYRAPSRPG
ncbi:ankyrin repeat domain containing protein [Pandoravirus celtis]|uniref:Ankyrin repeat domain containing protein n=1 Tax=Pandoravirus celtis TaxID=2568002 RepID=A0A4D6EHN5_9VIRU|nr:ankyrin repeat domain containing protein [Pandoravirus celtis]